jgi:2-methylisocitrate lyase-like PEP mutase family enzyme
MAFIPYVKTKEEVRLLKREVNGPVSVAAGLHYNISEFTINDCREIGIARVSLPAILIFASVKSIFTIAKEMAQTGTFENIIKGNLLIDQTTLADILKDEIE